LFQEKSYVSGRNVSGVSSPPYLRTSIICIKRAHEGNSGIIRQQLILNHLSAHPELIGLIEVGLLPEDRSYVCLGTHDIPLESERGIIVCSGETYLCSVLRDPVDQDHLGFARAVRIIRRPHQEEKSIDRALALR
jgi:hypothetical protein